MTNVDKLIKIGIIGDIRQRFGADNGGDESKDDLINELSNNELMLEWSAWCLGYASWWKIMKNYFDQLEQLDKENV